MELKLRQYRDGKRFCDGVVELAGIDGLNRAWRGPESLPTLTELADPGAWVARSRGPERGCLSLRRCSASGERNLCVLCARRHRWLCNAGWRAV